MVMYGFQMKWDLGHIIMDGPGFLITIGVGLPFTMAAGCMIMHMDGCGYLVINGHLPGFRGEAAVITMDGHRLAPAWISILITVQIFTIIIGRLFLAVILIVHALIIITWTGNKM